jgi:hypothetical protein
MHVGDHFFKWREVDRGCIDWEQLLGSSLPMKKGQLLLLTRGINSRSDGQGDAKRAEEHHEDDQEEHDG